MLRSRGSVSQICGQGHLRSSLVCAERCRALARLAGRPLVVVRSSTDPDDLHETKLGPNVAAGIKDVKERLTWSPATVIRNE